ncbi:unnamed protein product [Closterium sp. NIES-64]|nr:unnamed protein product [Closterium sp. NIES-64]
MQRSMCMSNTSSVSNAAFHVHALLCASYLSTYALCTALLTLLIHTAHTVCPPLHSFHCTLAQVNGAFEGILDREGQAFHVHAADYVLGLADLTGEVMRLAVSSRAAAAADGGGGAAAGNAGGGDGGAGSTGKGTSRRGKRQREQPEAQAKASGAEPAAASEPVAAAEPEAEAGEGRGELVVDADACRLFVQRLYAGFSLLPRSSELGKEMGKKMDVMLASLNKIENEYPEDLLQLGLEGREAGGVEGE